MYKRQELRYISVDKPAGYNAGTVREELEAYSAPEETPEKTPNIIVIMNEEIGRASCRERVYGLV